MAVCENFEKGDRKWLFVKFLSKIMTFSFQERKFGFRLNRETCFDITKTFYGQIILKKNIFQKWQTTIAYHCKNTLLGGLRMKTWIIM